MLPLIVLVATTAIARALGAAGVGYLDSWAVATAVGLAAMFVTTGLAHFVGRRRKGLVAIVPSRLPARIYWLPSPAYWSSPGPWAC